MQARGVVSNLHGVIDHNQESEDEDNDIPDVPVGYTSEYQIAPIGKDAQRFSGGTKNQAPPGEGSA